MTLLLAEYQLVVLLSPQGVLWQKVPEFNRILSEKSLPFFFNDAPPLLLLVLELAVLLGFVLAFPLVHFSPQGDKALRFPLVVLCSHSPLLLIHLHEPVILGKFPH